MWLDTDDKHLACQLYLSQSKAYLTVQRKSLGSVDGGS